MNSWKKVSSKQVLRHPRLTVVEDEIIIPGNKKIKYLRFKNLGNSVTVICRRSDGKILLQREFSYPTGRTLFQFPGGFVPKGESSRRGAARELAEEAGLRARSMDLLGSYFTNNRRSSARMYVYFAKGLAPVSPNPDSEERIESRWLKEREVDGLLKRGRIQNYSVLAAWSLYRSKIAKS